LSAVQGSYRVPDWRPLLPGRIDGGIDDWIRRFGRRNPQQPLVARQLLLQRVAGHHLLLGFPAQWLLRCRIVQYLNNPPGNGGIVEEIDPPTVLVMTPCRADGGWVTRFARKVQ
jgi:hypothetical protein